MDPYLSTDLNSQKFVNNLRNYYVYFIHLAELLPLGGNSTTSDGCPRLAESAK